MSVEQSFEALLSGRHQVWIGHDPAQFFERLHTFSLPDDIDIVEYEYLQEEHSTIWKDESFWYQRHERVLTAAHIRIDEIVECTHLKIPLTGIFFCRQPSIERAQHFLAQSQFCDLWLCSETTALQPVSQSSRASMEQGIPKEDIQIRHEAIPQQLKEHEALLNSVSIRNIAEELPWQTKPQSAELDPGWELDSE
jgi:hypothetical protein